MTKDIKVTKIAEFEVKPSANVTRAVVEARIGGRAIASHAVIICDKDKQGHASGDMPLSLQAAKALVQALNEAIEWIELEDER